MVCAVGVSKGVVFHCPLAWGCGVLRARGHGWSMITRKGDDDKYGESSDVYDERLIKQCVVVS